MSKLRIAELQAKLMTTRSTRAKRGMWPFLWAGRLNVGSIEGVTISWRLCAGVSTSINISEEQSPSIDALPSSGDHGAVVRVVVQLMPSLAAEARTDARTTAGDRSGTSHLRSTVLMKSCRSEFTLP
jgi:hypothetical protein